MKIVIVGATGTIGNPLTEELEKRHKVIKVGSSSGDIQMDMSERDAIRKFYNEVQDIDAVVMAAGKASMKPFEELTEEDFEIGFKGKIMGQVNMVLEGKEILNKNGSFTLISGILSEEPIANGAAMSFTNGAINSFVIATAPLLKNGLRINAVCPGLVEDSVEYAGEYFPGHNPVPMEKVVNAYLKSIEGVVTGQVIKVYG